MSLGGRVPAVRLVTRRSLTVVLTLALLLGSSGCGVVDSLLRDSGPLDPADVTPVVLQLEDGPVELTPWAYCLGNTCVDGSRPQDPHDVGPASEVRFTFARDDWEFTATFRERGGDCPRTITVPVETSGDHEFLVRPAGPADDWEVDVFGRGDGDVITTFRWHTPTDGRLPGPASGTVAILADHDGELDSYGVELFLSDLATQPRQASAVVTVTSADGRTVVIEPRRRAGCYSEGEVQFDASRSKGLAATDIGPGPFTYTAEVTLDGRTYVGTGEWPEGETPDLAPHVPLTWDPALPSYVG